MPVEIQVLHFAVLKVARQSNSVVGQMRLFTYDDYIVFSALCVELQHFLAIYITQVSLLTTSSQRREGLHESYSNHT